MYQALKLPHHLHDYRSDRVRKRSGLTEKYPRLSCGGKKRKKKEKGKEGKKKRGKKARYELGETLENAILSFCCSEEFDGSSCSMLKGW